MSSFLSLHLGQSPRGPREHPAAVGDPVLILPPAYGSPTSKSSAKAGNRGGLRLRRRTAPAGRSEGAGALQG